jgi:hypothetical protein
MSNSPNLDSQTPSLFGFALKIKTVRSSTAGVPSPLTGNMVQSTARHMDAKVRQHERGQHHVHALEDQANMTQSTK